MHLPILEKLKEGEKFDFETLADNIEQTYEFWDWWWTNKYVEGVISRPEMISDNDEILISTDGKPFADLLSHQDFFDETLFRLIKKGILPGRDLINRPAFQKLITQFVTGNSVLLPGRPQVIFAGGGYGSGKTTVLNELTEYGKLPVGQAHHVGVDVFKPLVPEYNLIKAVADGRASFTVQRECQQMASTLFGLLIDSGRSFIWDSSMSNKAETLDKIDLAKRSGYELTMIAVLTPLTQAIAQAMGRAKKFRRFPHFEALPKSHSGFRQAFQEYVDKFDGIIVFANDARINHIPVAIAEKKSNQSALVVLDQAVWDKAFQP